MRVAKSEGLQVRLRQEGRIGGGDEEGREMGRSLVWSGAFSGDGRGALASDGIKWQGLADGRRWATGGGQWQWAVGCDCRPSRPEANKACLLHCGRNELRAARDGRWPHRRSLDGGKRRTVALDFRCGEPQNVEESPGLGSRAWTVGYGRRAARARAGCFCVGMGDAGMDDDNMAQMAWCSRSAASAGGVKLSRTGL